MRCAITGMLMPVLGDILVCYSDQSSISIDSVKHRCQYMLYGEFTRCVNSRDPVLPRTRFLRSTPVRGIPGLLCRRCFHRCRLPTLWLHSGLFSRLVSSFPSLQARLLPRGQTRSSYPAQEGRGPRTNPWHAEAEPLYL